MDVAQLLQSNASATNVKVKPAVPKKPVRLTSENDVRRTTRVRDMIRKLQERERTSGAIEPSATRVGGKGEKTPAAPEKAETDARTSRQTLEDLKAIDEDIEKLRSQIEERDKIISALREAAQVKDKKLDDLAVECSKLRSRGGPDADESPGSSRAGPLSPPESGGSCWTGSFAAADCTGLLRDRSGLENPGNDLRAELGSKEGGFQSAKVDPFSGSEGADNAINLIMAEQIRLLKEREAQLVWEAEELREQNDLMEFRILELEECRKEFLDKEMMNVGKHRAEKIVWRERDLEEVSDSGVVSLPTSEDLTSDSELGDAIRNYSPLGAVPHLGLTPSDGSHSDPGVNDLKPKKSLKSAECLQESGIFVDAESSDCAISAGSHSKACQTESVFEKTLLDIIDSSCDLFLSKSPGCLSDLRSDDLTTEISKLSAIQRRLQQKTRSPAPRNPHAVVSCPHANSVLFYEERLGQLEDKLKIYESSGDAQGILLAKRLQKEVELARRVKELTDRVASLEAVNKKLEEEKCEFEEAENDARFQCQRLEVRLQELIEKNADLELEVERRKAMMSEEKRKEKKKGSLEGLLNKYEKRNFELEENEAEAKKRLSMIEAAMPAIVAYNVYKMVQRPPDFERSFPGKARDAFLVGKKTEGEPLDSLERLEAAICEERRENADRGGAERDAAEGEAQETAADGGEEALRSKIRKLEARADRDREALEEMTKSLKAYEDAEKSRPDAVELFEELKQMVANEIELRAQIERLEKKERAYMQSLEKADEIWAGMEADYKRRLLEAEVGNEELRERVSRLEKSRAEVERVLAEVRADVDLSAGEDDAPAKIRQLALENEKLKEELGRRPDESSEERRRVLETDNSFLRGELKRIESYAAAEVKRHALLQKELELAKAELHREREVGEKLRKDLEENCKSQRSTDDDLRSQISELTQELGQKSKELSSLEVTVAELREEVETLENKVGELVETIHTLIKNQEEVSTAARTASHVLEAPFAGVTAPRPVPGDAPGLEEVEEVPESPFADEMSLETETETETESEFFFPAESRITTHPVLLHSGQETRFVYPRSEIAKLIFLRTTQPLFENTFSRGQKVEKQEKKKELDAREEEIFQLRIKNTELQQTLERMDEESKLKDKEFEELQKVALEIRKEQENLMLTYGKTRPPKATEQENVESVGTDFSAADQETAPPGESKTTPSIEFLQIINPIVIKTSDHISAFPSSLQVAFDNLQSKCRWKSSQNELFLKEAKGNDVRDAEAFARQLAIDFPLDVEAKRKNFEGRGEELPLDSDKSLSGPTAVGDFREPESSPPRDPSTPVARPALAASSSKVRGRDPVEAEPEFSYVAPITTVRRVGNDGIFLEWDVSRQPESVMGFEIKVNGLLSHRVRSSTRNKALLHSLNLKDQISIQLFAVSKTGRSTRSSHFIYPNEYFLRNEESLSCPSVASTHIK